MYLKAKDVILLFKFPLEKGRLKVRFLGPSTLFSHYQIFNILE
jgi:hypothetical protein